MGPTFEPEEAGKQCSLYLTYCNDKINIKFEKFDVTAVLFKCRFVTYGNFLLFYTDFICNNTCSLMFMVR